MTFVLGLTGSIGMGKSTTAEMFRDLGVPVWDADETVRALYGVGGDAVTKVGELCPAAVRNGRIDKASLRKWLAEEPNRYNDLEKVVHPMVSASRRKFIESNRQKGVEIVVIDVPLLFETGSDQFCDGTVLVTISSEEQRRRVLKRPGMTEKHFQQILEKQMPDHEKRKRATYVIETKSLSQTREKVEELVGELRRKGKTAHATNCSRY